MDAFEIMQARHSVRSYLDRPIEAEKAAALRAAVEAANQESGLHIQLFTEEPEAFANGFLAHYGVFKNCRNYFALVAPDGMDEAIGYYGERLVLLAQELGLSTCWVGATYRKGKVAVDAAEGERLQLVIALGYGADAGKAHKNKPLEKLADLAADDPDWYRRGLEAALLAPTAINQQKFHFRREGSRVFAAAKSGPFAKVDLGIVKYHFQLGAGKENFKWA